MKQHDDDSALPHLPQPRRRTKAQRPVWPFPSASLTPPGGGGAGAEAGLARADERLGTDPVAAITLMQRRES